MKPESSRNMLTPRLRFPEFQKEAGWRQVNGNETFDLVDRRPAREGLPILAITQEHGAIPRDQIDYHVSVTETSIASYKEVQPKDFIISLRSFQGGIEYSQYHGICSPAYIILKRKGEGSDGFFRHLFKSERFIQQLTRNIEGLRDGKMISFRQFSEQLIPIPSPVEQKKIADCLTSLDELIAAQARKLAALAAHKKALMQQLFPREGETLPRLRFPEFCDAGEWEEKELGTVVTISKGKGVAKADLVEGGTTPCIRYAELYTMYGEVITDVRSRTNIPVDNLVLSQPGDVIVPASGETKEDIATCACVIDGGVALGSDLNVLRSGIDGSFLSYYLNGSKRADLAKVAQGDTVAHLYPSQISQLSITVPPSPAEQQRIADCLNSVGAAITAETEKLAALRTHKKGLMQQLFPSAEED